MRLSTSLVAVKKVTSPNPKSLFDSEKIDRLALQILKAEGIISPLFLRRIDAQSYEVVEGHFEYYAAAKAREIDPRKGEMVAAYIIESDDAVSEAIAEQIKLLKQSATNLPANEAITATPLPIQREESNLNEITEILKSVLSKVNAYDSKLNSLGSSLQKVVETTERLALQQAVPFDESNLEVMIQRVLEKCISESMSLKTSKDSPKKLEYDLEIEKSVIDGLNSFSVSQLSEKLTQAGSGIAKRTAEEVCKHRLSEPYKSIEDITSRKGSGGKRFFTKETLNKLLKVW